MIFCSPEFIVFFCLYLLCHQYCRSARIAVIVVGSLVFYSYYKIEYTIIPVALTVWAYFSGRILGASAEAGRNSKIIFFLSGLLLPLLIFKYKDFILIQFGLDLNAKPEKIPLGISFFTFSLIAYLVEVSKGTFPVEKSFFKLLSYVLYFPHMIAGPILKPAKLIPQLSSKAPVSLAQAKFGVSLFCIGLFKKMVLADNIAPVVDMVYNKALCSAISAPDSLAALLGFSIQIYCDFSGYTDMALGVAALLGVRMPRNFLQPYASASPADFWRRWHVTLSQWLRDYLYIPLGGSRGGGLRTAMNVVVTMFIGGLWHGASWNFALWGVYHAVGIIVSRMISFEKMPKIFSVPATFLFVSVGWVLFRAQDMCQAVSIFKGFFSSGIATWNEGHTAVVLLSCLALAFHPIDRQALVRLFSTRAPGGLCFGVAFFVVLVSILFGASSGSAFIYFDF